MANQRRRILTLAIPIGMVVGGVLQKVGRLFLPVGAVKSFFTTGFSWQSASAQTFSYFFGTATFGPAALDVSLLALLGLLLVIRMALAKFE